MAEKIPYDTTSRDIEVRIQSELRNPNIRSVTTTILRDGPRVYRYATLYEIINPATEEHHHYCLRLDTYSRSKSAGWSPKPDKSVTINNDGKNELGQLAAFIEAALSRQFPIRSGDYHVVESSQYDNIRELLGAARSAKASRKLQLLKVILENLDVGSLPANNWLSVFQAGAAQLNRTIASAARLVEYRKAVDQLQDLCADPSTSESEVQRILAANAWMFGSEYSELLERRTWTRDDRLDFMLRRTVDGYLEIIEIKTPFAEQLFRYDSSHDSFSTSAPLSRAIGQVIRYIEEVERHRDTIIAKDKVDSLKIRARLIIGRDGEPEQMAALRNLNGHLHRIEVLTFDQLLRIAKRVLSVFEVTIGTASSEGLPN